MIIHHSRLGSGFLKLPNETIRDERLSIAARGHLAYLLSQPSGWSTTADAESKRARALRGKRGEGRDAMRRIYAELKAAGYLYHDRKQDNGTWSTEIHIADRPRSEAEWKAATDVRLTDVPETRMSVPPAEMPEGWPEDDETFPQVAPMYGSPGVGSPDVGPPVHRQAVQYYEAPAPEDPNSEAEDGGYRGVTPSTTKTTAKVKIKSNPWQTRKTGEFTKDRKRWLIKLNSSHFATLRAQLQTVTRARATPRLRRGDASSTAAPPRTRRYRTTGGITSGASCLTAAPSAPSSSS